MSSPFLLSLIRSLSGSVMSSANSSTWSLGRYLPLYQYLPPLCSLPPFLPIFLLQVSQISLYLGRCSLWIEKKTKSSTHLNNGPMPAVQRMSSRASPNILNNPPDDFFPKHTQVLIANGLLCSSPWSLITTPGHWSQARGMIL